MIPHGVMFHHFHDGVNHPPGQGSLDRDQLAALLRHVADRGRILEPREWAESRLAGRLEPGDVCLTFDDGLRCQYEVALPVLDEMGLKAFWFVYTGPQQGEPCRLEVYRWFRHACFETMDAFHDAFMDHLRVSEHAEAVERALDGFDPDSYLTVFAFYTRGDRLFRYLRDDVLGPASYHAVMDDLMAVHGLDPAGPVPDLWMGPGELLALSRHGHVLGLHSHTHPTRLCELSLQDQEREYQDNARALEAVTGSSVDYMSHPCNSYGPDTLDMLAALGVRLGFRANMEPGFASALECPRRDHADIIRGLS